MSKYRADSANDISYNRYQSRVDAEASMAEWFEDFYQMKREQCYSLTMDTQIGDRTWVFRCQCGEEVQPTQTYYIDDDGWNYCDSCFEKEHEEEGIRIYNQSP
jgi:hypothetical protein